MQELLHKPNPNPNRTEMTEEQQKIAIAEACGWTAEQDSNGYWRAVKQKDAAVELWLSEQTVWSVGIPDYLSDLNAMHEAEKVLIRPNLYAQGGWGMYLHYLSIVTDEAHPIDATAVQRAEAFLRTINKWEETKL